MLDRLRRLLAPSDPVERALTAATMAASLATGLFYSVSALYFTRVIGLEATTVGVGLTIAGAVGVLMSFAGGYAADRVGADRLQLWANVVQGLAFLAYVAADGVVGFVLVACVAVGSRSLQGTAKATVQARWFTGAERVAIRARLRVITNVFIGLGTVLAGAALLVDTATAYQVTMLAVGAFSLLATVPLAGLRRRAVGFGQRMDAHLEVDRVVGPSPLRDRTYLGVVGLNSVIAMQFGMTSVGVPLWIVTRTEAPEVVVSVLLVLNTVIVALFQVRAARGTHDVLVAGRAVRRGSLLLAAGCLLYGAAGSAGAVLAVVVLVAAEVLGSWAEVWCEAGAWGLAFELADPVSAGRYQGLSQTGYSVASMVAPALVTATAVDHGLPGWLFLAALFAAAGAGVAAISRAAAARRTSEVALVA
ncbi:MFS transporter [Nocardioides sp. YIM 152315]|uniref:MFS transporter n=1 Tax=Nocardioides sp. YIM 152315 TaxID=3031760 RepID=UPI0023DBC8CE|nr:MFS transporter [Nocardioides sp. YIM 152315]MDF1603319.1 MFS transporter [Nocardioides sp. YIM 152315]